jgi:hypothetical protein
LVLQWRRMRGRRGRGEGEEGEGEGGGLETGPTQQLMEQIHISHHLLSS